MPKELNPLVEPRKKSLPSSLSPPPAPNRFGGATPPASPKVCAEFNHLLLVHFPH
jgi:hypothetical protein